MKKLVVLGLALVALSPGGAAAQTVEDACGDAYSTCLSATIVFNAPEDWDLQACYADYLACVIRQLKFW